MKYKRDKNGNLWYVSSNGKKIGIVSDEDTYFKPQQFSNNEVDPYTFSVDDEADDEWEDKDGIDRPWSE